MTKISKLLTALLVLFAVLSLSACGEKGLVIKNGPAGPNTRDLLRPLPEDLVADQENARHSEDDLKPIIN